MKARFLIAGLAGLMALGVGPVGASAQGPSEPGPPDASWATITGVVLDEVTGQPASGVPMRLQCNWLDGRWGTVSGTTDAGGRFTIDTPPGQCTLVVNAIFPGRVQGPGLRLFEFAPGETVDVVTRLPPPPVVQPLEGRVLDERGDPISGAAVILRSSIVRAGTRQWTTLGSRPLTDATGAFRFASVGAGTWEVVVPLQGLSRIVEVARGFPAPAIEMRGAPLPAFRVAGRVEAPAGASRSFAIFLDRADSPASNPLTIAEAAAAEDGSFSFPQVPPGSYRLRIDTSATRPGSAPAEIFWAVLPVVVTSDVSGVVLTPRPGPELRAEVRLDDQPSGVSPAPNVLLGMDAASGRFQPNRRVVQGQLVTRGLFPERYRIRHTGIPSGYRVKSVTVAGRDVTEEGFDLSAGPIDDMVITLTNRITAVTGVVRDAQNLPDGEASVLAFPTNPRLWTGTGQAASFMGVVPVSQKGNYALTGLPPGEYFIIATASSGLPVSRSMYDADTLGRLAAAAARIRLTEGEAVTLNLRTAN